MGSLDVLELKEEPLLYVNGKRISLPDGYAHYTLLEYLRGLGLTGTKLGCGEGGCGACTVMVSHFDTGERKLVHRAVNACLAPLYAVEGMHVTTIEGIGSKRRGLHKVQAALATAHGSQCGFCTPGFVMSMYSLLRSCKEPPTQEQIEESLAGNLCRCTGYRAILDAFRTFTKTDAFLYWDDISKAATGNAGISNVTARDGSNICPSTGKPCDCGKISGTACADNSNSEEVPKLKERELIFPPELMNRKAIPLVLNGAGGLRWHRPLRLDDLLNLKKKHPDAKLVVGNSELGIETRFKSLRYPVLIAVTHIQELNTITVKADGIDIGASVTLEKLYHVLRDCIKDRKPYETSGCSAIVGQLKWFAGAQIRNVASIGGNICTASPISDLNPLWIASGAVFSVIDCNGVRTIQAKDFFIGYRKIALKKGEILSSVHLPWTRKHEFVKEFKQSHRRDDDIALVNAGMRVLLEKVATTWQVVDISLVYGGVAAVPLAASQTEAFMKGKAWDRDTLNQTLLVLQKDITVAANAPGGMAEFRQSLISSFFFKFFLSVTYQLEKDENHVHSFPEAFRSGAEPYKRNDSHGQQNYQTLLNGAVVGQPLVHASAELQVSGEAEYVDDMPLPANGFHAALVLSTKPHARIISMDAQDAEAIAGFVGFFSAKDVPGKNDVGAIVHDEELFATEFVTSVGQIIGIVVADALHTARLAALKVKVTYEELPAILSIEEAVAAGSFIPNTKRVLRRGDVDSSFNVCDHLVEGTVQMGGQEHFYLEPNGALVWTLDSGNEVSMICSTQTPQKHQKTVADVLGIPMHRVVCKTKRIGGGFGGKETRPAFLAAAASVPAYLLQRPVKLILDREVDMAVTGQRHPFLGKYKVGFSKQGKIMALQLEIYNNGGNSLDLSGSVLERAIFHSDNVYEIPNVHITGQVCFTNLPSNTAFRGFGGPQGLLVAETWIEHVAHVLERPPAEIRELNLQSENSEVPYGQVLEHCRIQAVWEDLKTSSECNIRRSEVETFNKLNRWRKRGIAMIPTKFGISFTAKFLNQAGALVQVYTDGTVLVTHGGVEMGQGLHTKVAQIAADAFGIPMSSVFISETSTDKVPNASATAASASSDLYGAATLDACLQIKERMKPLASTGAYTAFRDLVMACYLERIDLSAHGFYKTPDIGFDWNVGKGKPFNYYTYGAACAEAEVDCLTGDFHLRRVDIVMDLGHSLNPAIDIGQIEGAFVQGLGWVALEELKWGDKAHPWVRPGHLFTQGPGTYKLPTINDVPIDFRVSLLKDAPNPRAIHSSKAVGEPPFFLGASVLFAIRQAVASARAENENHEWFSLDSPATPERIRMACMDDITARFAAADFRPKLSV